MVELDSMIFEDVFSIDSEGVIANIGVLNFVPKVIVADFGCTILIEDSVTLEGGFMVDSDCLNAISFVVDSASKYLMADPDSMVVTNLDLMIGEYGSIITDSKDEITIGVVEVGSVSTKAVVIDPESTA